MRDHFRQLLGRPTREELRAQVESQEAYLRTDEGRLETIRMDYYERVHRPVKAKLPLYNPFQFISDLECLLPVPWIVANPEHPSVHPTWMDPRPNYREIPMKLLEDLRKWVQDMVKKVPENDLVDIGFEDRDAAERVAETVTYVNDIHMTADQEMKEMFHSYLDYFICVGTHKLTRPTEDGTGRSTKAMLEYDLMIKEEVRRRKDKMGGNVKFGHWTSYSHPTKLYRSGVHLNEPSWFMWTPHNKFYRDSGKYNRPLVVAFYPDDNPQKPPNLPTDWANCYSPHDIKYWNRHERLTDVIAFLNLRFDMLYPPALIELYETQDKDYEPSYFIEVGRTLQNNFIVPTSFTYHRPDEGCLLIQASLENARPYAAPFSELNVEKLEMRKNSKKMERDVWHLTLTRKPLAGFQEEYDRHLRKSVFKPKYKEQQSMSLDDEGREKRDTDNWEKIVIVFDPTAFQPIRRAQVKLKKGARNFVNKVMGFPSRR
ncbi:hypothetical protein T439DRAFT_380278 [Meredithblackwellia eburnea MCA 4105]